MALRDPIAVYNAASNTEAHLVRQALASADVEAHVTEDVSQVGVWLGGLVPEIHKPQVWVERADAERAKPILEAYERTAAERRAARARDADSEPPIEVVCEDCGKTTTFSAALRGSVEQCASCGAYVDIGEDENESAAITDLALTEIADERFRDLDANENGPSADDSVKRSGDQVG